MARYRWFLSYSVNTREVFPIWKDDLAKEYAFEQGQYFRRATLSSSVTFIGEDYDWLMAVPFGTKIGVRLQIQWTAGGSWENYWQGSFYMTDCTVNTDDKTIVVKPNVEDQYNKILAGLDKEFDLMKLKPEAQYVNYKRRPLLQIYTLGEGNVSCFLGGMAWEQEVTDDEVSQSDLIDVYHFGVIGHLVQVTFENAPTGLTDGFMGAWYGRGQSGEWSDFGNDEGLYYMTYFQTLERGEVDIFTNGLRIYAIGNTTTKLWEFSQDSGNGWADIPATFTMQGYGGRSNLDATWTQSDIFGRWLLGYKPAGAENIPTSDIVAYNRNYRYCYPYAMSDIIRTTSRYSTVPTDWGKRPDGNYYEKPQLTYDEALLVWAQYPVARTMWQNYSIWLQWSNGVAYTEEQFRATTMLRDAYTLEAVINALLSQIDTNITFQPTSTYSEFLFGTNSLTNRWGRLAMTPKTNIKVAEYTQPAQKAPMTLNDVFQMLKNACGCYWFIDASNRLRIEHISWFKAGGTYASGGALSVGYDLTAVKCSRNGKSWAMGTGTYNYEKISMPERYQYAWADETTDAFKGRAIEVLSGYVEPGKIEEVNIALFNPDVDYIMLNPSNVSDDGMVLLCCQVSGGVWQLTFETETIDGDRLTLQNFQLSMMVLQPSLLISDMPSWNVKVNNVPVTAKGIQRMKKQQVSAPCVDDEDMDMQRLVKTTVGNGEVERASIRLTSRMTKYNLRYDTAQQ